MLTWRLNNGEFSAACDITEQHKVNGAIMTTMTCDVRA